MKMKDGVWKYIDVSTSHVTQEDCAGLEDDDFPLVVHQYDEGFWILVPFDDDDFDSLIESGASVALAGVLKRAKELDCYWVKLDRDGNVYEDIIKFDW